MENDQTKEKEVKQRMQTWFKPSTLKIVDGLYKQDNCRSKTEFIEKAILFYAGYLSTESARAYLPNVVTSTLKSIVAESDNRTSRILFKIAVELAMLQNIVAATNEIDDISLNRLRGECVKEVTRLKGSLTFDDALDWQKG